MKRCIIYFYLLTLIIAVCSLHTSYGQPVPLPAIQWEYYSTEKGDIPAPNAGNEQTSCAVLDVDQDGIMDFVVTERQQAPSVVWYKKTGAKWTKYIIDNTVQKIEAGNAVCDVDRDGDDDVIFGGEYNSNRIWWWENPYPNFDPQVPWTRHLIKDSGKTKHHDLMLCDFDGDFNDELVFWNQGDNKLFYAEFPADPKSDAEWEYKQIYAYSDDGQMQQRGTYPSFKGINEHEGLAKADMDGDGIYDIVGGGSWFKYLGNGNFRENIIDAGYTFSRAAAGQLKEGGRPEVVLVVGDGVGPMVMYEYQDKTWVPKNILGEVDNGHSIAIMDFNNDGHLDIFNGEMRFDKDNNPDAKLRILLGDGKGNFTDYVINQGFSHHEDKIADLDGDGDLDILAKPYAYRAPGIDIWLQNGTGEVTSLRKGAFNKPVGLQPYSLRYEFAKDVPGTVRKIKEMGFKQVEVSGYYGKTAKEFQALLDQDGLKCPVMMFDYNRYLDNLDGIIKEARLFGATWLGVGWIPHTVGSFNIQDAQKACDDFNAIGKKLKEKGCTFFYHPHGYEFAPYENGTLMDYIMAHTDKNLVYYEMDTFWTIIAGVDPLELLKKYPGRYALVHLKDLRRGVPVGLSGTAADETSVALGAGVVNFPALLREAVKQNIKFYFIEDEAKEAIDQVPVSLKYLKTLQ
jgi:sugar phosphate isomerase/epimerase